jgi:hypothetical protein
MKHDDLTDLSVDLVNNAEKACADSDPDDLGEAAGMVLVGDVYGMIVTNEDPVYVREAPKEPVCEDPELKAIDALNPFIR